ncbi:ribonuclease III [Hesseltinella vesiculosa]|uniref:Large ribosomal subunit protein mL44 n=1 Tax=Hesseltinella vesiculosa TaxID=101127 RepID=A0A1X2GI16_9FUNG|nr:ribonuclease III [Hesseltinella vesiculosa]
MVLSRCRPSTLRTAIASYGPQRSLFHHSSISLNNAGLYAFRHRLNLGQVDDQLVERALTHSTADASNNNAVLSDVGLATMNYFTVEYIHAKYPQLPARVLQTIRKAYTSLASVSSLGERVGVQHVMRWERPQDLDKSITNGHQAAVCSCVNAIVGALYQSQGPLAARQFVHDHLLNRPADLTAAFQIAVKDPKRELSALLSHQKKTPAESRLLSETGRLSRSPVYVVGVFSGEHKLGEGFGSSLRMAEFRACRDALISHYGQEQKDLRLPSEPTDNYVPPVLGESEAVA